MLKIVSFKICPFVQRVTALLETKQTPYEIEYISLKNKPQWFLDISPHGQVPVLITETGERLFESDAIVEYLEEAYSPLVPSISPEQKAINRAWSYLAAKNYLVQCSAQRSPNETELNKRSSKLEKAFSAVEFELGDFPYFNSKTIGMVDIAWLPILHHADLINQHTGYDFLAGYPRLKKWQQRLLASGLAEKSVAEDFKQAFTDFYLSNETFLGNKGDVCNDNIDQTCASGSCC